MMGHRWILQPSTPVEKTIVLCVTFAISKFAVCWGTVQLSPVQLMKLEAALEEGGRVGLLHCAVLGGAGQTLLLRILILLLLFLILGRVLLLESLEEALSLVVRRVPIILVVATSSSAIPSPMHFRP